MQTRSSRDEVGSRPPIDYLTEVPEKVREAHFLPVNENLYEIGNFEVFLRERKRTITDEFSEHLNQLKQRT